MPLHPALQPVIRMQEPTMNKPLITACLMCTATAVAAADLQEMGDMSKEMVARAVTPLPTGRARTGRKGF